MYWASTARTMPTNDVTDTCTGRQTAARLRRGVKNARSWRAPVRAARLARLDGWPHTLTAPTCPIAEAPTTTWRRSKQQGPGGQRRPAPGPICTTVDEFRKLVVRSDGAIVRLQDVANVRLDPRTTLQRRVRRPEMRWFIGIKVRAGSNLLDVAAACATCWPSIQHKCSGAERQDRPRRHRVRPGVDRRVVQDADRGAADRQCGDLPFWAGCAQSRSR